MYVLNDLPYFQEMRTNLGGTFPLTRSSFYTLARAEIGMHC